MPKQISNMGSQDGEWRDSEDTLDDPMEGKKDARDLELTSSLAGQDLDSIRNAPAANVPFSLIQREETSASLDQKEEGDEDAGVKIAGSIQPSTDVCSTWPRPAAGTQVHSPASNADSEDSASSGFVEVSASEAEAEGDTEGEGSINPAPTSTTSLRSEISYIGVEPATPTLGSPARPAYLVLDSLAKVEWRRHSALQAREILKACASGQQSNVADPGRVGAHSSLESFEKLIERARIARRQEAVDAGIIICSVAIGKLLVALETPEPWRLELWEAFLGAVMQVVLLLMLLWQFPDGMPGSRGGALWHAPEDTPVIAISAAITIIVKLLIPIIVAQYMGADASSDLYWAFVLLVAFTRLILGQRRVSVKAEALTKALPWTVSLPATSLARGLGFQQLTSESIDFHRTIATKQNVDATTQRDDRRSPKDRLSRPDISFSRRSAQARNRDNASKTVDAVRNRTADHFIAAYQQVRHGLILSLKALLASCECCLCFLMVRWDQVARDTLGSLQLMLEPTVSTNRVRIRFVCSCGKAVWDDYPIDLEPQTRKLEGRLDKYFREVESRAGEDRKPDDIRQFFGRVVSDLKYFSSWLRRKLSREERGPKVDNESQEPDTVPATVQDEPYYLTSVPSSGDRRPRLVQAATSEIQDDRAYFAMLRAQARTIQHRWFRFLVPRKIKAIQYVQMHLLHDNQHVDIFQSVEPQFPKDKEEYSPVETQLQEAETLYLGSNTLLHFFEKEHDCCQYPHALSAIPKKLKGKLSVPERGRPIVGWGMQLVDGIDTFRLGLSGFAGLLASSLVGLIYARLHDDVQGGSGISQCLMYFVTFVVTMHGVAEFR